MTRVAIIGAGLSGLAAAEILSKYFRVDVFEKEKEIGGLARNFKKDGIDVPAYYHHIIKSNKNTLEYLEKFGKINTNNLKWQRIKVAIAVNKKVFNINNPLRFINFSYLNLYEKIRFGLFGLYTIFLMNPEKIKDNKDARTWLEKRVGKRVTDKIFHHLYAKNKFDIPLDRISAKQFAHRLSEKEVYDYFTFPDDGYNVMIESLADSIKNSKGKIITNARISRIDLNKKELTVDKKKKSYDIILNTAPFPEFLKVAKGLSKSMRKQLEKIKYCPAVCVCFGTKNLLDKEHYWINFFNERIHMLMQHSILKDRHNEKINWCLRYGGSEKDLSLSDKEIKKKYLGVIKNYFPKADIKWAKVFKTRYGEPIYDINYGKHMPEYKSENGLYFAGVQITYPKIRNMDAALSSGKKVAHLILKDRFNKSGKA